MSNVLCVYENMIATVKTTKDFFELENVKKEKIKSRFVPVKNINNEDIEWSDILFLIRPNHKVFYCIAKKAKKCGKYIIVNCDDDLLHLPKGSVRIPWRRKALIKVLGQCDFILSPNPYICKRFKKYAESAQCMTLDTAVSKESIKNYDEIEAGYAIDEKVKIVYAAGIAHTEFFNEFIMPIMPDICKKYKDRISLTCIGVNPDLSKYKDSLEIEHIDSLPLHQYREKIVSGRYDIGLAPLTTTFFTKAKYFNKFIEYSLVGIVGVYSNTEPYTFVVEDGKNGFLADNTKEGWLKSISQAIDDRDARKLCKKNAYNDLITRFSEEKIIKDLVEQMPEIKTYKNNVRFETFGIRIAYRISLIMDWIYKSFFYFSHGGISVICEHVNIHMKSIKKGQG